MSAGAQRLAGVLAADWNPTGASDVRLIFSQFQNLGEMMQAAHELVETAMRLLVSETGQPASDIARDITRDMAGPRLPRPTDPPEAVLRGVGIAAKHMSDLIDGRGGGWRASEAFGGTTEAVAAHLYLTMTLCNALAEIRRVALVEVYRTLALGLEGDGPTWNIVEHTE